MVLKPQTSYNNALMATPRPNHGYENFKAIDDSQPISSSAIWLAYVSSFSIVVPPTNMSFFIKLDQSNFLLWHKQLSSISTYGMKNIIHSSYPILSMFELKLLILILRFGLN